MVTVKELDDQINAIAIANGFNTYLFGYSDEVNPVRTTNRFPILRVLPPEYPLNSRGADAVTFPITLFIHKELDTTRSTTWAACDTLMRTLITKLEAGTTIAIQVMNQDEIVSKYYDLGQTVENDFVVEYQLILKVNCSKVVPVP